MKLIQHRLEMLLPINNNFANPQTRKSQRSCNFNKLILSETRSVANIDITFSNPLSFLHSFGGSTMDFLGYFTEITLQPRLSGFEWLYRIIRVAGVCHSVFYGVGCLVIFPVIRNTRLLSHRTYHTGTQRTRQWVVPTNINH